MTKVCMKRITEATKRLVKRDIEGAKKVSFNFDSWFYSKWSDEAALEIRSDMIGMFKTNTKGFCKDNIDNLTVDKPGGSFIAFKRRSMCPGHMPLISIG